MQRWATGGRQPESPWRSAAVFTCSGFIALPPPRTDAHCALSTHSALLSSSTASSFFSLKRIAGPVRQCILCQMKTPCPSFDVPPYGTMCSSSEVLCDCTSSDGLRKSSFPHIQPVSQHNLKLCLNHSPTKKRSKSHTEQLIRSWV